MCNTAPPKLRQIEPQALYFTYILPYFDWSTLLHFAGLDVDIYSECSYLYVEKVL